MPHRKLGTPRAVKTGKKKRRDWRKKFVTIHSSQTEHPDLTCVTYTTLLELSSKTQIAIAPLDSKPTAIP